jgi:hypothetical protein
MRRWVRVALFVLAAALYAAVGWVVGLAALGVALVVAVRRFRRTRRALAPSIGCPWCREQLDQYGPFSCAVCRGRSLGWAWRCALCGAWVGHIQCPSCGMSVTNPILGAS